MPQAHFLQALDFAGGTDESIDSPCLSSGEQLEWYEIVQGGKLEQRAGGRC